MTNSINEPFRIPTALRRVPQDRLARLLPNQKTPTVGDVALARVEKIGKNTRLELADGRACTLHEGDRIAVVFGNRYASSQFEGYVRTNGDLCDLLSMGGVCGIVETKHEKVLEPSRLRLLGAIGDADGRVIQLREHGLLPIAMKKRPRTVVVVGSSMDAGKTYTVMSTIIGLKKSGARVGAAKLTGTASGRDSWSMVDAGAHSVLDFVDGGWPSTYLCSTDELVSLYTSLVSHSAAREVDWIVIEVADGILQRETSALLQDPRFTETVDAWLFAAGDPLAAYGGLEILRGWGIEPIAVSGVLAMSPLGMREATARTGVNCFTARQLQNGELNDALKIAVASRAALLR